MDIGSMILAIGGVLGALKVLVIALLAVAALTPTEADDNALHRVQNLLDKLLGLFGKK